MLLDQTAPPEDPTLAYLRDFMLALDLKGCGSWAPVRAADFDASAWGDWEAWEHATFGELPNGCVGATRTGEWVAYDMKTGTHFGFPTREQAERLAVLRNENAPTRVVHFDGTAETSAIDYDALHELVEAQMLRDADQRAVETN